MNNLTRDAIGWDIANWSKALTFWEKEVDLNNKNYSCLELGSWGGGLSMWMASKGNSVICSDLENPEKGAGQLHSRYSLTDRIRYEAIDGTRIPYESAFDIVAFKSVLGGIARNGRDHVKAEVIAQIHKALKPGGKLLFAENLAASKLHQLLRRNRSWGSSWNYLRLDEVQPLFSEFESVKFETAGFLGIMGRNEAQRTIIARADTLIFDKLLPRSFHYIVFGVATRKSTAKIQTASR